MVIGGILFFVAKAIASANSVLRMVWAIKDEPSRLNTNLHSSSLNGSWIFNSEGINFACLLRDTGGGVSGETIIDLNGGQIITLLDGEASAARSSEVALANSVWKNGEPFE